MMERENQRRRDEGAREYNVALRDLVRYVKRNDPRKTSHHVSDAERDEHLRNLSLAQALKSRVKNQTKAVEEDVPQWAKTQWSEESEASTITEEVVDRIECFICKKVFRSKNQLTSHERSKKHAKAARDMRRQTALGSALHDLTISPNTPESAPARSESHSEGSQAEPMPEKSMLETGILSFELSAGRTNTEQSLEHEMSDRDGEPDSAEDGRRAVEDRSIASLLGVETARSATEQDILPADIPNQTQQLKTANLARGSERKPRRSRRAKASASTACTTEDPACVICHATFTSKTKLFNHIRESGHSAPITEVKRIHGP